MAKQKTGYFEFDTHTHAIEMVYEELRLINKKRQKGVMLDDDSLLRLEKLTRIYGNLMSTYKDLDALRKQVLNENADDSGDTSEDDSASN